MTLQNASVSPRGGGTCAFRTFGERLTFPRASGAVLLRKLSIVTAIRYEASHYITENCLDWVLSSTQTCTTWRWTTIKKSGRESIRGSPKDVSVTGPSRDSRVYCGLQPRSTRRGFGKVCERLEFLRILESFFEGTIQEDLAFNRLRELDMSCNNEEEVRMDLVYRSAMLEWQLLDKDRPKTV
ncbi:MAG: hypothetical protein J3Q66DRAFT_368229 [Benniella sp.]|nr:MAG: hypothetical protein J3Q66DRAFT_368229 [Benniella sp.]